MNKRKNILQSLPLPRMHEVEGRVDVCQWHVVGDKLVDHQLLLHVLVHQFGHAAHTLKP